MNDVIYKPLIEDMTWSYSRVNCFNDCTYRWYLHYIYECKSEPQFYSSYGSFMHKLIEKICKNEIDSTEAKTIFLTEFKDNVSGELPGNDTVSKFINCGLEYFDNFKPFPCEILEVEKRYNFEIEGKKFVGIIDCIGKSNEGYWVIDNKSRNLKQRSKRKKPTKNDEDIDSMLKQLYLYSAIIKKEYGEYPKYLCFNCFKNGEFIKEEFDEQKYHEAIDEILKSISDIENVESFYPNIDFFSCKYICDVNKDCIYWNSR